MFLFIFYFIVRNDIKLWVQKYDVKCAIKLKQNNSDKGKFVSKIEMLII